VPLYSTQDYCKGMFILFNKIKILALASCFFNTLALADTPADPFLEVVAQYRAANPKPVLSEVAHKFKVQAEFAQEEKRTAKAIELYNMALIIAPWWPEGHYKLALSLAESKKYRDAMLEMKRFMLLEPDSPDVRTAQDKIYQWESVAEPVAGKTFKDCPNCPEMVELPAGSLTMGSEYGDADERPVHIVTIDRPFAIGKTEVTQAQWLAVMGGENPSYFSGCGDACPVEQVSWEDTQKYIQKLNTETGKHYRLPSEAEWEYACRAGNQQEYCGSDQADRVAWNSNTSGTFFVNSTHPVATKTANAFGLYDMSGNVWEWVEDNYHESYSGAPSDGSAWLGGSTRVLRGGSWGYNSKSSRASARSKFAANFQYWSYGFRLARTLP
jgi:formylglycine-generating enzyme required for sulfatase activity